MGSKKQVSDPVIQFAQLYLEAVRRLDLKIAWSMLSASSQAFLKGFFYASGQLSREKLGNCTHEDLQEPLEAMLIEYREKIEDIFENTSILSKPIYDNSCQAIVPLVDIKAQVPVYFIRPTAVPGRYFLAFVKEVAECCSDGEGALEDLGINLPWEIWRVDLPRMLAESSFTRSGG